MAIRPDGYDKAVIGIDMSQEPYRLVYDKDKMVAVLLDEDDELEHIDAIEYLEYNVWNTFLGPDDPIYIQRGSYDEVVDYLD